ncbi:BZ3500_MvSof-1268-A1-R1_Chr10-1g02606 [Microbotryum saponariae]|uniref:BZ3500_MvSof-1268-A1-R1_Chr10-1g02606 protein n=1 Tax=Microbotryum saponariae TaxID=289078 RepID=A0A2X0L6Z2_9BASI|nr:BZ3500_MvSof-1268-A1-R1_Chr10-1g02606 [Microbotryum saponariae]SDA06095.1 BZ3501_MvSof-1269-A2-R1_Chr10-1g02207 [Microbotryum saponariae]
MSFALRRLRGLASSSSSSLGRTAAYSTPSSSKNAPNSSTSAADYKLAHPRRRPPALPTIDPPRWSAEQAVNNILYNTPPPSREAFTRHTLNCLVQNEPGVLSRVSGCLAARGFNIDSLVVCATEISDLSRMCIVLRGQDGVIEQARRQLEDLVPVWAVLDYTRTKTIERELLLAKISILGPEYFEDQLANKGPDILPATEGNEEGSPVKQHIDNTIAAAADGHPGVAPMGSDAAHHLHRGTLTPSEALRQKHTHLQGIQALAAQFGGKVVDLSNDALIVEMTGKTERVDAFLKLVRPYGILEAARSGLMVMPRAPIKSDWAGMADDGEMEDVEAFDTSLLPPG